MIPLLPLTPLPDVLFLFLATRYYYIAFNMFYSELVGLCCKFNPRRCNKKNPNYKNSILTSLEDNLVKEKLPNQPTQPELVLSGSVFFFPTVSSRSMFSLPHSSIPPIPCLSLRIRQAGGPPATNPTIMSNNNLITFRHFEYLDY